MKVEEVFNLMKEKHAVEINDKTKVLYENFLNFSEFDYYINLFRSLMWISKNEHEIAKTKLTEILRNTPDNIIILNNLSTLNLYMNKVDKAYLEYKIILDQDQMNSFNDITYHNINVLTDIFNLPKYQ